MSKRTDPPGLGSLGRGALTAGSLLLVSGVAAVVGVVIAREFGRTPETDGLLAAYGVFIVIAIAGQAIRIAVLPPLARAQEEDRLAGSIAGYALALAVIALPLVLLAQLGASQLGGLLTGGESAVAEDAAADVVQWIVPAAVAYLFSGLAASGLAALDDYATAAFGYAAGGAAGLVLILTRAESDGIIAVAWGMTLNGTIALLVPTVGLGLRAARAKMPRRAIRPGGVPLRARLATFGLGAAVPLALQLLYVVCLPFAGRQGTGAATSFVYAYLAASALVTITGGSLGLVTTVPLTRSELNAGSVAHHVVAASWLALVFVGAGAGVFALAGSDLVEAVLGQAYGGDVGTEVGRLIVALSPWMTASVAVAVTFPLAFVAGRVRKLPMIAISAIALQIPLAWLSADLLGLEGLALSLALSTLLVLAALLVELRALSEAARGLVTAALVVCGIGALAFVPPALLLDSIAAAAVGVSAYVVLLLILRPRGLMAGWRYLRVLS